MTVSQRDAGLVRAVGPWGLAASIVSMVIGAGIFAVPSSLAAGVGSYAPLAILACALAVGAVAICFAEGGSRIPSSGGAYVYISAALGPLAGYVAGTLLLLSDVLACGGVTAALAEVAASLVPQPQHRMVYVLAVVAAVGAIAWVNVRGVRHGLRLLNVSTIVKLVPLLLFIVAGIGAVEPGNLRLGAAPGIHGAGRAIILALFSFMGMEASLCASGELIQPSRTIPRALALAMAFVTLLYAGIQTVAQGILGTALASSAVPLADAMGRISPLLRLLMLAGAALSMFGWLSSDLLASPRLAFAFGRDGWLPRALGRLHPRSHSPYVAILCYAGVAMALALTGSFAELAVLSTLATAVLYIAGCAAAWRLSRRGVAQAGAPLGFRWLGAAMVLGIGSMLVLIALAAREEIIGLLVVIGLATAGYLMVRRPAD